MINYEYPPIGGGAGKVSKILSNEFVKLGHDVTVLTSNFESLKGATIENGVNVIRCKTLRRKIDGSNILEMLLFDLVATLNLKRILKKREYDVSLIFFTLPCGPLGLFLKSRYNLNYAISMHGVDVPGSEKEYDWVHKLTASLRRKILKESIANFAVSESLKKLSEANDKEEVVFIPNGVDTSFFLKDPSESASDIFEILFVGRIQNQKNLFYLIDRLSEIYSDNNHFRLTLVGDGPQKNKLMKYAESKIEKDNIKWISWVDQEIVAKIYQSANCFVLVSYNEGMPLTALEAMASGLPVIASKVVGNVEVVRHGETGYLFDLDKPEDFNKNMIKLMNNPGLCSEFGKNARSWVEKDFSWTNVARKYINVLKKGL